MKFHSLGAFAQTIIEEHDDSGEPIDVAYAIYGTLDLWLPEYPGSGMYDWISDLMPSQGIWHGITYSFTENQRTSIHMFHDGRHASYLLVPKDWVGLVLDRNTSSLVAEENIAVTDLRSKRQRASELTNRDIDNLIECAVVPAYSWSDYVEELWSEVMGTHEGIALP